MHAVEKFQGMTYGFVIYEGEGKRRKVAGGAGFVLPKTRDEALAVAKRRVRGEPPVVTHHFSKP